MENQGYTKKKVVRYLEKKGSGKRKRLRERIKGKKKKNFESCFETAMPTKPTEMGRKKSYAREKKFTKGRRD